MNKVNYGIRITFDKLVPSAFVDGELTSEWNLAIHDDFEYTGRTYVGGYITNSSGIKNVIDIMSGGTYSYADTSFNFSIRNGGNENDQYSILSSDIISGYGIPLTGARIQVISRFTESVSTSRTLWNGYIRSYSVNDTEVTISCNSDNRILHKSVPDFNFTKETFPFIADKYVSKPIPEVVGTCPRSKLIPVRNKREVLPFVWQNYFGESRTSVPVTAVSNDGTTLFVFRRRGGEEAEEWQDKTGYVLNIISGSAKGESREIVKNGTVQYNAFVRIQDINIARAELEYSVIENEYQEYEYFVLEQPIDDILATDSARDINSLALKEMLEEIPGLSVSPKNTFAPYSFNRDLVEESEDGEHEKWAAYNTENNAQLEISPFGHLKISNTEEDIEYSQVSKQIITAQPQFGADTYTVRFDSAETLRDYIEKYYKVDASELQLGFGDAVTADIIDIIEEKLNPTLLIGEAGYRNTQPRLTYSKDTSYICLSENKAQFVGSLSTVYDLGDEIIYHDDDFGEIEVSDLLLQKVTDREESDYPGVILRNKFSPENPSEFVMETPIAPSKIMLTDFTVCNSTFGNTLHLQKKVDLPQLHNRTENGNLLYIVSPGTVNDARSETIACIEVDVYLDDLDRYRSFEKLFLGGRVHIEPDFGGNNTLRVISSRVSIYAIDQDGILLRNGDSSTVYNPAQTFATEDDDSNLNAITIEYDEDGETTGYVSWEGLPPAYYESGHKKYDISCSKGDVLEFLKDADANRVIKGFKIKWDMNVRTRRDSRNERPEGFRIFLDEVGFIGYKKMDMSKLAMEIGGLRTRGNPYVIGRTAPYTILNTMLQVDQLRNDRYDQGTFDEAASKLPGDYIIGRQITNNTPTYEIYDGICKNSMLGMFTQKDGQLAIKYWLDEETPVATHNSDNILAGSVSITPNIYSDNYTEYNFKYGYDEVVGDYLKEGHIRHTDEEEFPDIYDYESSQMVLDSMGLPSYLSNPTIEANDNNANIGELGYGGIELRFNSFRNINLEELGFIEDPYYEAATSTLNDYSIYRIQIGSTMYICTYGRSYQFGEEVNMLFLKLLEYDAGSTLASGHFQVYRAESQPKWKSYCNLSENYTESKLQWEQIHEVYSRIGIKRVAPADYTELRWIHDENTFKEYIERYIAWIKFAKTIVNYDITLTTFALDSIELLNLVEFSDKVHTNYTRYGTNSDGSLNGEVGNTLTRNGWIVDYMIDTRQDKINISLILKDEGPVETLIIDENEDPVEEITIEEDSLSSDRIEEV